MTIDQSYKEKSVVLLLLLLLQNNTVLDFFFFSFLFFFFFFFFFEKQTYTQGRGKVVLTQKHIITSLKAMVTFKRGWSKLYYTQHILLSNMRQLSILFFFFFFWELNEMIILEVNKSRRIEMNKNIKTLLKLSKN